jgi:hypothetical protein
MTIDGLCVDGWPIHPDFQRPVVLPRRSAFNNLLERIKQIFLKILVIIKYFAGVTFRQR